MSNYVDALLREDSRLAQIFNVEADTLESGSALIEDPFPGLARLREKGSVQKGALGDLLGYPGYHFQHHMAGYPTYSTLSFKATNQGLIRNDLFSSRIYYKLGVVDGFGETILNKGGADHLRYRGPIQPMFSPQAAESWWNDTIIAETVEALIRDIETKGGCDLSLDLCARMPVHVVSAGFGIDPEEIISFRIAITGLLSHNATPQQRGQSMADARSILLKVITDRRSRPREDIISKMIAAPIKDGDGTIRSWTDDEIISHCILIVLAGGGTTWRQLGITIYALLNHPEQLALFMANRDMAGDVILEAARWHPTDLVFPRIVEQDTELEGVMLPKGAMLHLCLGSANRDPARWENPDRFDITRPVQRSLAFGGGPHSCLGQHVSRQEMVVALNAIFDRLPNLRWDPEQPPARLIGDLFARGPSALPVLFG
ncbi:cytochrome P450 [Sphingobium sp. Sx8-8]|uniref:cytochrome P450 n=1 Tax=Sphingobium sp. Sx8-8 TaxID=2933617 RepID=UPI001F56F218|nr:cytochrome P450 [Sphingobium sp. Sx8-8]